jgi:addiction module HigA family antidote
MANKKRLAPIPPGEILLEEFMKPMGISINRLARDIAVPPGRISTIVNGKRSITADTALRLSKYFGVSSELWLGLQADYDLRIARRTVGSEIERRVHRHVSIGRSGRKDVAERAEELLWASTPAG